MQASINTVVLMGAISKHGVTVKYSASGAACASFQLICTETGADGKPHDTWVPVTVWGKRAEPVSELEPGAVVLVQGKLGKQKKDESWDMVVSTFDAKPVLIPTASSPTAPQTEAF